MHTQISALDGRIRAAGIVNGASAYAEFRGPVGTPTEHDALTLQHYRGAAVVEALLSAAVDIAEAQPLTIVEHERIVPLLQRLRLAAALDPSLSEVQAVQS